MPYLLIVIEEPTLFRILDCMPRAAVTVDDTIYKRRVESESDPVFYDWIIDECDVVRGLEIHLPCDHSLLKSDVALDGLSLVETTCFPRIWVGQNRSGIAKGIEAFGDISFFGADSNRMAIVVRLDSWLSPSQVESLLASLTLYEA